MLPSSSIMRMFCTSSLSALVVLISFFGSSLVPTVQPPVLYTLQVPICDILILFVTHHTHSAFFFCHLSCNRITLSSCLSSFPLQMSIHTHSISHQYPIFSFVRTGLHCRTCGRLFLFLFSYSNCNHFCSWDCHYNIPCINFLHYLVNE